MKALRGDSVPWICRGNSEVKFSEFGPVFMLTQNIMLNIYTRNL